MRYHHFAKRLAAAILAVLCAGIIGLPAKAQEKQLVIGRLKANLNMHPLIQVNTTKRNDIGLASRPITAFDPNGNNVCRLCETLPTIDNGLAKIVDREDGAKGMEVTIKLRQGLAWGDGVPVTSKDILFTWQMAKDPKIGFQNFNPWTRADQVDVVDDRTVVMHLKQVDRGYTSWDQILPEHLERPIYEAVPNADEYNKQSLYNRDTTNPGLWNGPYVFTEWQPGTIVRLEKNLHWPGPGPKIDRLTFTYRDSNSALFQTLLADAVDYVLVSPGGINFSQFLELRRQYPGHFNYPIAPGNNMDRIAFKLENPILMDVRVRQAIALGLDRKAISDALFDGLQAVADGPLPSSSPFYNGENLRIYSHDSAKARELLAEAGWKPGGDGICVNGAGERLSIELLTTSGERTREQMVQVMQNQLREVCIDIVLKFATQNEFSGKLKRERQFTGMLMGAINFPPSASPRLIYGSDNIPTAENNWVGENFSGYVNKEMDAAVVKVDGALTRAQTKEGWDEIQRIFSRDLPFLPLYFSAEAVVTKAGVTGISGGAVDPRENWAEEWDRQ